MPAPRRRMTAAARRAMPAPPSSAYVVPTPAPVVPTVAPRPVPMTAQRLERLQERHGRPEALTTLAEGFKAALEPTPAPQPMSPVCGCCGQRHTDKWCDLAAVRAKAAAEQPTAAVVTLEVD